MLMRFLPALFLLFSCSPSSAQWVQQKKEDPFDGKHLYIALTAAAGYGFGLRCEAGSEKLEVILVTSEKVDSGTLSVMNLTSPKLIVIVDSLPPMSLEAILSTSDEDKLLISSDDGTIMDLAAHLMSARKRVAVAVEAAGQKFHKTQFGVSGTKKTVGSVVEGCKPKN